MLDNQVREFDVIVIGGGVIGASIFHHLAKYGLKSCLIEKNTIASGCTAWSGGIVRSMHANPELSDQAIYGLRYYQSFLTHTNHHVPINNCGFLYFPNPSQRHIIQSEVTRLADHIPIAWLSPTQLEERFGNLLAYSGEGASYEADAGYLDPVAVTKAWVRDGCELGGVLNENTALLNLEYGQGKASRLITTQGEFFAKWIVFAAGADTANLIESLGYITNFYPQYIQVDLRIPKQNCSNQPAFIDEQFRLNGRPDPLTGGIYIGHPTDLKAEHVNYHQALDPEHSEKIYVHGQKRFSWVSESTLQSGLRSLDCYNSESMGMVLNMENKKHIIMASGFSGGGFKMAPWVGREVLSKIIEY